MKVGVCNIQSENFERELVKSVINTGFAVITHHGISHDLIKESQLMWKEFYKHGQAYKNIFINGNNTNMGYKAMGTETAVGSKVADLKEFFHWRPGEELPETTKNATSILFRQLNSLGMDILAVLEKHTQSVYVKECEYSANTILRVLYYPAMKALNRSTDAVRAAAHEDINYITLLVAATAPGLQVMDNEKRWHDVPHEENSIIVNIGDMLALQSEGLYKSTTHRVINPSEDDSDRISMPLFIHPEPDTILAPGITAGKFLQERIDKIYGKK